jgi:hypothetical protein
MISEKEFSPIPSDISEKKWDPNMKREAKISSLNLSTILKKFRNDHQNDN